MDKTTEVEQQYYLSKGINTRYVQHWKSEENYLAEYTTGRKMEKVVRDSRKIKNLMFTHEVSIEFAVGEIFGWVEKGQRVGQKYDDGSECNKAWAFGIVVIQCITQKLLNQANSSIEARTEYASNNPLDPSS